MCLNVRRNKGCFMWFYLFSIGETSDDNMVRSSFSALNDELWFRKFQRAWKTELSTTNRIVQKVNLLLFWRYFVLWSKTKQNVNIIFLDCFGNIFSNKFILGDACPPIHKTYLSFTTTSLLDRQVKPKHSFL